MRWRSIKAANANHQHQTKWYKKRIAILQYILHFQNGWNKNNTTGNHEYTKGNSEWEGYGTALKPSHEPIVVARKPLSEKTVVANILKWGVGGINIDACRIKYTGKTDPRTFGGKWKTDKAAQNVYEGGYAGENQEVSPIGRFPANFIHDGSDEVISFAGEAARFFYCAKASKRDRDEGLDGFEDKQAAGLPMRSSDGERGGEGMDGTKTDRLTVRKNIHPTVKPTDLMRYLCRLITPTGGVILDPFMGSGSTGKAALLEGFSFIGCELSPEYFEIAKARIEAKRDLFT